MNIPIPLGGIAIQRNIDKNIAEANKCTDSSKPGIFFSNYPVVSDFVKQHSQEMSEDVMRQHIDLYVNNYSIDLGKHWKRARLTWLNVYNRVRVR